MHIFKCQEPPKFLDRTLVISVSEDYMVIIINDFIH